MGESAPGKDRVTSQDVAITSAEITQLESGERTRKQHEQK
jgi:hypothetical protein